MSGTNHWQVEIACGGQVSTVGMSSQGLGDSKISR